MRSFKRNILFFAVFFLAATGGLGVSQNAPNRSRRSANQVTITERTIEYRGNARFLDLVSGNVITSSVMQYDRLQNLGYSSGNVRYVNGDGSLIITTDRLNYDDNTEIAEAVLRPVLYSTNNNLSVKSVRMRREFRTDITTATGNVEINRTNRDNGEISSGTAGLLVYDMKTETVVLTQDPVFTHINDTITGERIEYVMPTETVNISGRGILELNRRTNDAQPASNSFAADHIAFIRKGAVDTAEGFGNIRVVMEEHSLIVEGDYAFMNTAKETAWVSGRPLCRMLDRDTTVTSLRVDYAFTSGKEYITFISNVVVISKSDGMYVEAGRFHNDLANGYALISETPSVYLEDRKVKLTADVFERFEKRKRLFAKGNVVVKGRNITAYSAIASYDMNLERITLSEGAPRLVQDGRELYASRIIIYPGTERFEFSDASGPIE